MAKKFVAWAEQTGIKVYVFFLPVSFILQKKMFWDVGHTQIALSPSII